MPKILDYIEASLLEKLKKGLPTVEWAEFSVGSFNLRGWKRLSGLVGD